MAPPSGQASIFSNAGEALKCYVFVTKTFISRYVLSVMQNWKLVSFVKRGRIRFEVLKELSSKPATPTEIAKAINAHRPSVSRALADLEREKLVECLTPNEKLGRIYSLTPRGSKILETDALKE